MTDKRRSLKARGSGDLRATRRSNSFERSERYYRITFIIFFTISVILQVAALGPLRETFWGYHLYAFVPPALAFLSWGLLGVVAFLWLRLDRGAATSLQTSHKRIFHPALVVVLVAVVAATIFTTLRSQQRLLGDALPLTVDLPAGEDFHPRQPFMMRLQHVLYKNLGGTFRGEGVSDEDVAFRVVATGSIVAGVIFVFIVFVLCRRIIGTSGTTKRTCFLATLLLLTQGYVLLFFGYVENYTIYLLLIGVYLLTALLHLGRRIPLSVVTLVFLVTMGTHLSTFALIPSYLFLVGWGLYRRERRKDAIVGIAVFVGGWFALDAILRTMSAEFSLWTGLVDITGIARRSQGGGAGLSYMFSWTHIRDFWNEHYLIGPLAAFLFVPAFIHAAATRRLREPIAIFLSLAALSYLAGSWATSEPLLGYARDWDLFAPAGVCYSAAGVYFLTSHVRGTRRVNRLLLVCIVFSALHLAPWVWITHSPARTLERFKTLPLGNGRTEVAVGNFYLRQNDQEEALRWFQKALTVNPSNSNAYAYLGQLHAERGRHDRAAEMLSRSVALRPDKVIFRNNYVLALLELERYEEALTELAWLVEAQPGHLEYWRSFGFVLEKLGRTDKWRSVQEKMLAVIDRKLAARTDDSRLNMEAGVILVGLGRDADAAVRFKRVLLTDPDSANALYNAGIILFQIGKPDEGRGLLRRFLRLHPDHTYATYARQQLEQ